MRSKGTKGVVVSRLISYVMLIGFVAQQFVCCCAGACVSACNDENHSSPETRFSKTGDSDCGHHHESPAVDETCPLPSDGLPVSPEHHHHVCVGTHLFYLTSERFDLSQLAIAPSLDFSVGNRVDGISLVAVAMIKIGLRDHQPVFPPRPRSALGVYRI